MAGGRLRQTVFRLRRRHDVHPVDVPDDVFLNMLDHLPEHIKRLDLVLDERIFLPVSPQSDALPQHVHRIEVIHPLGVDHPQHDDLLQIAHVLIAEQHFPAVIILTGRFQQIFADLIPAHVFQLGLLQIAFSREQVRRILDQPVEIPLLGMNLFVDKQIHPVVDQFFDHKEDVFAQIFAMQNLPPLSINHFTLLVHHVVIFQHVLTGIEMLRFHFFLRLLDGPRNQGMLDRLIFLHPQFIHQGRDVVSAEQTHQIIFQGQIETGGTRVALTT